MTYLFSRRKRIALPVLAVLLTACSATVSHRGYQPRAQDMQKVQVGMTKAEVEATLGSPSTTATINTTGDSYYYISSTVEQQSIFEPKEVDRKVFAIRFNPNNQVESFANYGLEDGRIININYRPAGNTDGGQGGVDPQQVRRHYGRLPPSGSPARKGQWGGSSVTQPSCPPAMGR